MNIIISKCDYNGWRFALLFAIASTSLQEQSLRDQGNGESADLVAREFATAWKRADVKLALEFF